MTKNNQFILQTMRDKGIRAAWVATELNMYDSNFCRMMRLPLSPERREQVLAAIEKLSKGDNSNG